ncbi:hypothetical protein L8C07_12440 [Paenibacillus sp. CMAA1739]|uniref:hypothetical protein n=1 Tax=Paenibacillus ottowii TaxID=2315729 RepID=UPI002DBDF3FE|nr:hypothetical protein [Paenibacillus sp. CMAA1739]MEC4566756.1 hypothetical protein [Paenibacillus sp. CMAA1739]
MTWTGIWDNAGPFIIGAITAVVIYILGEILCTFIPKGLTRDIYRILLIVAVVVGTIVAIYISSGIWANR